MTHRASTARKHRTEAPPEGSRPGCSLRRNLPLVYQVVAQMARRLPANVQRDDLLSAGTMGLLDSIRRNGGDDGETFASYARIRIRGAIFDELRSQDWLSRRMRDAVDAAVDGEPPPGHALPGVAISIADVTMSEEASHLAASDKDPLEELEAAVDRRALVDALAQLPERERRVVHLLYYHGAKLKDVGAELGVSEPRVCQLHARAIDRLRAILIPRPTCAA